MSGDHLHCPSRLRRLAALLLAVAAVLFGALGPARSGEDAARRLRVQDRTGAAQEGDLVHLADGQLTLATPRHVRLATRDLVAIRRASPPPAGPGQDPLVLLTDGDLLAARAVSSDDESLIVRWARQPTWKPLSIPLEAVRGLIVSPPDDAAGLAALWARIDRHRERHDLVLLSNGDTLSGEFLGLGDGGLELKTPAGRSMIDLFGVRGVAFNPDLTAPLTLSGEGALVSLVDGSRVRVTGLTLGLLDRLEGRTLFGGELEVPLDTVESVRFLGGCATYLSDLAPAEFVHRPFLDLEWPWQADRSVLGGPLRLRGTTYPKGLGLHSACDVRYALDGQFRRFQATVGIDDDALGGGSAVFEVLVDGRPVWKSDHLTGDSPAVVLDPIDLTGARELTLRVGFGERGDILDRADWCDAVLIK